MKYLQMVKKKKKKEKGLKDKSATRPNRQENQHTKQNSLMEDGAFMHMFFMINPRKEISNTGNLTSTFCLILMHSVCVQLLQPFLSV